MLINLCPLCKKISCDSAIWQMKSILVKATMKETDLKLIPKENQWGCTVWTFGREYRKYSPKVINGKTVEQYPMGSVIAIERDNWVEPAIVTYQKVEKPPFETDV